MLKGSHFLCEMNLTYSRLIAHKFTSAFMGRLMSSGWLVFHSKRNEEGPSSSDNDDDDNNTRATLISNSNSSETKAALIADAAQIAKDARAASISSTKCASRRAGITDEDLQAMLVSEADLESGTIVAPNFGELITGCEGLFAALKRILINPIDPLAGVSDVLIFITILIQFIRMGWLEPLVPW